MGKSVWGFIALLMLNACTPQAETASVTSSSCRGGCAGIPSPPSVLPEFVTAAGDRVFFSYDSVDLSATARATLDRQAAWLKRNDQWKVVVEGHADDRGTREYNLALGERRAAVVRTYLLNQGIPPERMTIISYGKERPAVPGTGEASRTQNRRGVSLLIK